MKKIIFSNFVTEYKKGIHHFFYFRKVSTAFSPNIIPYFVPNYIML